MIKELRQLDIILNEFYITDNRIMSVEELFKKLDFEKIEHKDLHIMLNYISQCGYLDVIKDEHEPMNPTFILNFKGLLFINNGGYTEEQLKNQEKNEIQSRLFNLERLTFFLTFLLVLSTLISAVYYGIEIAKYFHWLKSIW